jgi:hypothetical protein
MQERNNLFSYPLEKLAGLIRETGFHCSRCARCCTRAFNGHVFLLDRDLREARRIDPVSIEPAPGPEFCDQHGTFYVSGYALRTQGDAAGSCWFLEDGRCRIYPQRFSICRIYPYSLRREPGGNGRIDWRYISRPGEHGEYRHDIPIDMCLALAREAKEYENAFLAHEISFLEFMLDYFAQNRLRHVQGTYNRQVQRSMRGEPVTVMAYCAGRLNEHLVIRPV